MTVRLPKQPSKQPSKQHWPAIAGAVIISLVLAGCAGAATVATPSLGAEPQAAAGPTDNAEKPVSRPPIVVPALDQDPARREELAALIKKSTNQPARTAETSSEQAQQSTAPAVPEAKETAVPAVLPATAALEKEAPSIVEAATSLVQPTPAPSRKVGGQVGNQAAEIRGIEAWINSDPLTIEQLRGKVVLVDFWTYTCINCIRTFPFLKLWNSRYEDDGLVIVGVHSPEFEFEKDLDNVVQATRDNSIVWPVALDNKFATWRGYSNRFWPAKYLIDQDGVVRYTHFGEGRYAETERWIRDLLKEAGADLSEGGLTMPSDQAVDRTFLTTRNSEVTRELYAGYERGRSDVLYGRGGYVKQQEFYKDVDSVVSFRVPDELAPHAIYFNGDWRIGPESSKHGRSTRYYEDYLTLVYSAQSVNAVLTSDSGQEYKVTVIVDGKHLTDDNKGSDIIIGDKGVSYLLVDEPRLYNILDNPTYVRRETLRMSSNSADFGLFAFTFGVYQKGSR